MKQHRFASHTPKEQRRLSNLGHIVEGLLLGVVGILALLNGLGVAPWAATVWPTLILPLPSLLGLGPRRRASGQGGEAVQDSRRPIRAEARLARPHAQPQVAAQIVEHERARLA